MGDSVDDFADEALFLALLRAKNRRSINWKTVAQEAGVHPQVLHRLARGAMPRRENRARLQRWLSAQQPSEHS